MRPRFRISFNNVGGCRKIVLHTFFRLKMEYNFLQNPMMMVVMMMKMSIGTFWLADWAECRLILVCAYVWTGYCCCCFYYQSCTVGKGNKRNESDKKKSRMKNRNRIKKKFHIVKSRKKKTTKEEGSKLDTTQTYGMAPPYCVCCTL